MVTPEVTVAVVDGGQVVAAAGGASIVPWWSFTKTVLAAAALTLVRDGALALDRSLEGEPYTLRQLLQHTAGLGGYGDLAAYHAAVKRGDDPWPVIDMLNRCRADELQFRPGEGWRYSNIGYLKVGQLIERVTQAPLGVALERVVLGPLNIEGAQLARERSDLRSVVMGKADGYHPGWVYHGLLVGPLGSAALLLDRLLDGALLPSGLLTEMQTARQVGPPIPGRPYAAPGYALGLMTDVARPNGPIGHTGGGPGTSIAVFREGRGTAPVAVAAFACCEDPGVVERKAFEQAGSGLLSAKVPVHPDVQ